MDMRNRKLWIGLTAAVLVVALMVTAGFLWHRQEQQQLVELRNEALEKLERDQGQYDEQSIVLNGTSKAKAEELAELYGAELRITANGRFATLTLPEGTTIRDVYAMDESLKYIEEMAADYQVQISEIKVEEEENGERLPMRPQYSVSDSDYELQTYLDYLNMGNVWNNYQGNGITVAVIDTGIDTDHPEFAGRISEYSYNATEDKIVKDWLLEDSSYDWSLIEDKVGHGTAVTGVIAATMNSGNVVGIAPNVNILVIKAECDEDGNFYRTSDLVFGLYYAIERDVQVVNMSFGGSVNVYAEAAQLAYDSDIICVAAAGNDSTSALTYPAADPNVIGVGALGDGWTLADYSNYGENTDLVAPGSTYTTLMGGLYGSMDGTSLASPIVAGAIALYMQTDKYTTFDKVTEILYASCYDLGDLGRDWYYGFGALDISAFILEQRGKIIYDMLTDELENEEGIYIQGHTLQELPEPERLYAVFDGWYYDDTFTQEYNYYADKFYGEEITLYAKWANEDDGVPYTYVILDDGTVEIRSYTGHRRYITIPEKIDDRIVSSIGDFAFSGQSRLREVGLPSGLRHIGLNSFSACSNLVTIQIPANVTQIEDDAFTDNIRLSSVAFLGNSKLQNIGNYAFKNCGKLERIELPASLTSVNATAFYGATALHTIAVQKGNTAFQSIDGVLFNLSGSTLVAFPAAHSTSYTVLETTINIAEYAFVFARIKTIDLANVQSIGAFAFEYAGLETLVVPDSVTSMEVYAFENNSSLSQITIGRGLTGIAAFAFAKTALQTVIIPNGVTYIGDFAFCASGLHSVIFEENSSLVQIGENAFASCKIQEIDIPASVRKIDKVAFSENPLIRVGFADSAVLHTIGESAFAMCWLLENIDLPDSLRAIDDFAFQSSGLKEVTIPAGVTTIGYGAFALCSNLTKVEVEAGNTVYHDVDGVVYNLDNTKIYIFPAGKEIHTYNILETVRTVMPYSFAGAWRVNTIVLPEGLTLVGKYGFYQCGANSYSLPSTLTNIMDYAFAANWGITGIALPEALVQIAEGAFSSCTSLQSIHIPDNVMQIGRYAFAKDWNLQSVTFNETAKLPRISFESFAYCGLTSFRVPANVSTMAQGAFKGCKNLTSFTFAANSKLESISAYMFDGCAKLRTITFEQGSALTSIQAHGLEGMDKLTSIDFGDAKLTNVDNFAFRFCESLSALHLPETVTNIGRYAFYGCKSLAELTIPKDVEHVGSYAFLGTKDIDLYFVNETLPAYLDENWDHGTKGYYTGVTSVKEDGNWKYAILESGSIAILKYSGEETDIDLTKLDLGAPITVIGGSAFEGSAVQTIVLPDTLTAIQAEAFAYSDLTAITIPAGVTFIGREAFAYTDITVLTFVANSQLSVMEQYAFEGTKQLISVMLPKSLKTLGTGVFAESGLQSVTFEQGIQITEIPQKAFTNTKLTSIVLPDSVTLVNHNAFNNVQTLQSVSFGKNDGIRLMSNAFYHTGLTSLHIPANVTYIGEYCFVALPNLQAFSVDENNPNYKAVDGLLLNKSGRKLVAVPAGRTGSLTVPAGVEEIGFGAFEETKLSQINFLPDANILTFGYRAFFKAENITSIAIPKSVISIDYYAFAYCENLQTVTFAEDNQLKGIYEGAFLGCINLENIVIPDTIVEISDFAFYGCSKIDELPISENNQIKGIYDYAFAYTGLKGEFTTPETLWDIGNYAFLGCNFTKVTIPDANKKILIIGIGAFEDCNQLTEITLPFIGASYEDEVISWFGYIFGAGSYEANEVYVPASLKTVTITEGMTTIYSGMFSGCTNVETLNIPHSVSVLWNSAFTNVTAKHEFSSPVTTLYKILWEIYIGVRENHFGKGISGQLQIANGVKSIESQSFLDCCNLKGVVIPEGVTTIAPRTFKNCSSLENITIPDGVTSIGDYAFSDCSNLKSITIPNGVTSIGSDAFYNCSSLTCITIPDSVISIGDRAYYHCDSLLSITFDENSKLTSIGESAFLGCTGLTSITIPENVTNIGDSAFLGCKGLIKVTNHGMLELKIGDTGNGRVAYYANILVDGQRNVMYRNDTYFETEDHFQFTYVDGVYTLQGYTGEEETVTLPGGINGCAYKIYQFSGAKHVIIPKGITSIDDYAFSGCSSLMSITIPDGVTSIGDYAFSDCRNLTNIIIPDGVTSIGGSVFSGCSSLSSITMGNGVTVIGYGLFSNCSNLKSITIPDGVTSIGSDAFYNCSSLTCITIPDSVTSIGWSALTGCNSLKEIVLSDNANFRWAEGILYDNPVTEVLWASNNISGKITILDGVTSIGVGAFYNCSNLTSITIPDSVTNIGERAFSGCNSLLSIMIPDGVTSIGYRVFADCYSLTSVTIGNGVSVIDYGTFDGCNSLTNVTIGNGVTIIGSCSFYGCSNLTSIIIPDSVTTIMASAFFGCSSLISITVPDSVTSIGGSAFGECDNLQEIILSENANFRWIDGILYNNSGTKILFVPKNISGNVTIPDSITSIGWSAFSGCNSLLSITIPDSVTSIGDYAFSDCRNLTNIIIPDSVTSIGDYAFRKCSSLTCITIPDGMTSIGRDVFSFCSSLTSITIPDSVISIGDRAFLACSSLTSITIPDSVTSIGWEAFSNCSNLKSITIPDGVTSIGDRAFYYCISLIKVINHSSLQLTIGDTRNGYVAYYAQILVDTQGNMTYSNNTWFKTEDNFLFTYADGVYTLRGYVGKEETVTLPGGINGCAYKIYQFRDAKHVIIPNGITSIDDYAFSGCSSLTSIMIPDSVTSIGSGAFYDCGSLTNVTIGNGVASIGRYVFSYCRSLTSITIPDGVTSIDGYAFVGCSSLTSITIPDSVTSIDRNALTGCNSLKEIILSDNAKLHFVDGILYDNHVAEILWVSINISGDITILDGVTSIGESAFSGCSDLTSITIPDSVTRIGDYAFLDCRSLTNIIIPDSVTSIGGYAFSGCSGLTSITIPNSVTRIGDYAFSGCIGIYNNPEYYKDCMFVIDGWLIDVDENVKYLTNPQNIRGVAGGAYVDCYLLTNAVWGGTMPGNIETLYITNINLNTPVLSDLPLTIKNIVICDSVNTSDLRYCQQLFKNVSGVTIYVESSETDLRWDDNFPGWSNGNIVIYGNKWNYVEFYDADGKLVSTEQKRNAEIIRKPIIQLPTNTEADQYELLGWDVNGDGIPDSIPATTDVDIHATAIIRHIHTHVYGEWYQTIAPTCTDQGEERKDCISCDKYETQILEAKGHSYQSTVTAPTCTEKGYTTHTCACGHSYTDSEVAAIGHKDANKDHICDNGCGIYQGTHADGNDADHLCDYGCGATLSEHKYNAVVTAPTCVEKGYTTYTCACGHSYIDNYENALGHKYDAWYETVAPTCIEEGQQRQDCSRCDHYETKSIAAKGHSYTTAVTAPTCVDKGYTTHTCACGHSYTDSEVAAIGHKDANKDHICDNSCGVYQGTHADGNDADHLCDYGCGATLSEHKYNAVVTAPTCTTTGYATHTCACGDTYTDSEVAATGHKDTNKDHICDNGCGVYQGTHADGNDADHLCDYGCGEVLSDHSYGSVVTAPTCVDEGYIIHTCACGHSYVDSYVAAIGHQFTNYVSDGNATTEADGTKTALCDHGCGAKDTVTDEGSKITVSDITSDHFEVTDDYIGNIATGTTVEQLLAGIHEAEYVTVLKDGQKVETTTQLGTGMVVQLKVGDKVVKEVEIVIAGDTSGDGKITITDMLSVKSHMLNKTDLEGASGAAADVSGDGNISITDFIQIKAHILGKSEIKPAATEVTTETRTAQNIEQQTIAVTAEPEDREEVSFSVTLLEVDCVCTEFLVPGKKTSLGLQVYHKERYV